MLTLKRPRSHSIAASTLILVTFAAFLAACTDQPSVRGASTPPRMLSSRVDYGRITAVQRVDVQNRDAQVAGALVGGLLGVASGSGQSSSNRALRGLGGGAAGSMVGGAMGSSTAFEYTVLINGTNTIRLITEKAGLRVGDCVSLERGQFNNIRLAPDDRCLVSVSASPVPQEVATAAEACIAATQQLLEANTDEDFERAERRMRVLCK